MANIKISELTALTPPDAADLVPVTDSSASQTKRTTVGEIVGIVNGDVDVANDGTATIGELPVSKLQDGAARQLLQTDAAGTGVEWTSNVDVPGTLDVTGATTLDSTLSVPLSSDAAPSLTFTGDPNTGIYSPGADQLAISTNGTGRLFVDASGNIKLTSNQYQALSHKPYGYSAGFGAVTVGAGNNNQGNIALGVDISAISGSSFTGQNQVIFPATGGLIPNNAGSDFIGFYSRNASDALILGPATFAGVSSGPLTLTSTSVGIGTSTFSYLANKLVIDKGSTANDGITIVSSSTSNASLWFADGTSGDQMYAGGIDYQHSTDELVFYRGGIGQMRLTSTGLGIGTTSPTAALNVSTGGTDLNADFVGTGSPYIRIDNGTKKYIAQVTGSDFRIQDQSANAERLRITSAGLVGIGTSSPSDSLHIASSGANSASIRLQSGDGRTYNVGSTGSGYGSSGKFIVYDITAGAERFCINSSGNVGIGTTSPSRPLHVVSSQISARFDSSSTDSQIEFLDSTGTVVFGSSSGNAIVQAGGQERARIDSSGRLLVGTSTSRIVEDFLGNGPQGLIQIEAVNSDAIMSIISAGTADASRAGTLSLGRHRNSTVGGTPTIVQDGDTLGAICFAGGDGVDMRTRGASIAAQVDGTPGANDMPGRLVFSVTADGAASPTEALRISSNRAITVSDGGHIVLGTGTGTKIGTSTSQKIGFFDETPIVQPTTGIAEAAFVENSGGTAVNVDSTFGGYTIQQVVQALQNLGLLA